jgi:hypothetical protein
MRKLLVLITGLAVAAAVALAVPGSASAAQYNVFQTEDGLCMGVQGGNMTPGTVIITWTCDESLNQFWSMDSNSGASGYWLLRNGANPNECLSVFQKATYVGAQLVIWPCKAFNDNQDQRWSIADAHSVPILNFNSGLEILPSGSQGSAVVQWVNRVPYNWTFNDFVGF